MRLFRHASLVIAAILLVPVVATGQAPSQTKAPQEDEFLKGIYVLGHEPGVTPPPGVKAPVVKRNVYPKYTSDAMREKIQGQVELQIVILADGTVARARVIRSLDRVYGLDDSAIAAARQFTFEPGTVNGEKVPMAVSLVLEFRLH